MKNKGLVITLISFLSVIAIGLIVGMILLMTGKFDFGFDFGGKKNMKLVDSYEAKVEDINKIDLNLYSTDVEIKESTDELIKVEYYSNKEKNADIKQEGNTIIVNEEEDFLEGEFMGLFNFGKKNKTEVEQKEKDKLIKEIDNRKGKM